MFFRSSFVTLIFALLALGMPVKRDMGKVMSDLQAITSNCQALGTYIDEVSPSDPTLEQIYQVHETAVAIQNNLKTSTDDLNAQNPPFDDAQASTVLGEVEKIIPLVKSDLSKLVDKRSVFVAYKTTPMVEDDLKGLKSHTDLLGAALTEMSPADKTDYEKAMIEDVDNAFASAIKEFSD